MSAVSLDLTPKGSVEIETLVNGPIQTNSYAVISDNECVIIDPAWEGERLVEHIRAEHPGVRVLGAVCTHGHADHVGGVAGVAAIIGAAAAGQDSHHQSGSHQKCKKLFHTHSSPWPLM